MVMPMMPVIFVILIACADGSVFIGLCVVMVIMIVDMVTRVQGFITDVPMHGRCR